jgi:hypothetical protein
MVGSPSATTPVLASTSVKPPAVHFVLTVQLGLAVGRWAPHRRREGEQNVSTTLRSHGGFTGEAMLVLAVICGCALSAVCFQLKARMAAPTVRVAAGRARPEPVPVPVLVARVEVRRQPALYASVPPSVPTSVPQAVPAPPPMRVAKPARRWTKRQPASDAVLADLREDR